MSNSMNGHVPSHALITEESIKKAIKMDLGADAKLLSWEIKDFTQKGDNYCSFVTSVLIKYAIKGEDKEKSYVTKLNALRPMSDVTKMLDGTFGREATILSDVVPGMTSQLKNLTLPPIKTPKIFASNLEERKEILITEDLRCHGYKMYDRHKGMDLAHTLLVMEELGRFHASSMLFQESLPNKSILKTFENLQEPWLDTGHPVFKIFGGMITAQVANTVHMLESLPKYEKCVKWLKEHMDSHAARFVSNFHPNGEFSVLTHGDCWTNNMLFRYDQFNNPIEIRFVDLQLSRMASPAIDLNYFLYSSLNGDARKNNIKLFITTYYLSFLKVWMMTNNEPPFTFEVLEEEVNNRKLFGMYAAIFLLPIIIAEKEDVMDVMSITKDNMEEFLEQQRKHFVSMAQKGASSAVFEERFLAVFDEMIEANVFQA